MMKPFFNVVSCQEALEALSAFKPLGDEKERLEHAIHRVLAETVTASEDCPGFHRSTMDGFAVRCVDTFGATETNPALLTVIGECSMGGMPAEALRKGTAMRIFTGGALPVNADAVVMVEHTEEASADAIEVLKAVAPYENVVRRGEDFKAGQRLLSKGRRLRPQDLGLLAAAGKSEVRVFRRVSVGIISSGDEIVPIDQEPGPGCVRDVNRYVLTGAVKDAYADAEWIGLVRDAMDDMTRGLKKALDACDLVLISGGSSMGNRDIALNAILSFADSQVLVHGVSISPGKPLIVARIGAQPVVGLPGHPASALICFENFVVPLIRQLGGEQILRPFSRPSCDAILSRNIASKEGRRDFVRVTLHREGDALIATPLAAKSGIISAMVRAHGCLVIDEGCEGLYKGDVVKIHLFSNASEDTIETQHLSRHENAGRGAGNFFEPSAHERLSRL
ncbi:MAG: gephyrin-like molybdotransferase Glp [Desulfomonilaceae bacterium]